MAELKEIGVALLGWDRAGGSARVCAVRVVQREGLGSVPSGELVMRTVDDGAGVMLGGAAEATVSELADAVLGGAGLRSRRVRLGEPEAVAAGLACGGTATLLAHAVTADAAALLGTALAGGEPVLMAATPSGVRVLAGADLERSAGTFGAAGDAAVTERGARLLRRGVSATETLDIDGEQALLDLWVPVPRVLVVGAGALGAALQTQAAALGWQFASSAGVAETEAGVATLTAADALVLLDHSPDFDAALLECARGSAFAGALGSRHTQAARRERLRAAGATDADLERVRGPVGLDLGARTPAETAVSIVAEMLARRGGRAPLALGASTGRIGA